MVRAHKSEPDVRGVPSHRSRRLAAYPVSAWSKSRRGFAEADRFQDVDHAQSLPARQQDGALVRRRLGVDHVTGESLDRIHSACDKTGRTVRKARFLSTMEYTPPPRDRADEMARHKPLLVPTTPSTSSVEDHHQVQA
jgi:hypothetical protein